MPCFEESKIRTAPAPGAVIVGEGVWKQASFYIGKYSSSFGKNPAITDDLMIFYLYHLKKGGTSA